MSADEWIAVSFFAVVGAGCVVSVWATVVLARHDRKQNGDDR